MKIGERKNNTSLGGISRPAVNQSKKSLLVVVIICITAALILWVVQMGAKAERTVKVAMLAQDVYKNQVITSNMLKPYDMLQGEFEKYAVTDADGTKKRRLVLWNEKDLLVNCFAAYPLQSDTYAEYRDFIKSRIDNSDNVLYSYPGKEIVPLNIGEADMEAFKTFLKPGDRLNIQAVFAQKMNVAVSDGFGGTSTQQVDTFKTETVFGDIMVADLLNESGESILDVYAGYKDLSTWEQAQLDATDSFKTQTKPKTLLVAITPEEKERYYYYLSKTNVSFKVSMPQRVD